MNAREGMIKAMAEALEMAEYGYSSEHTARTALAAIEAHAGGCRVVPVNPDYYQRAAMVGGLVEEEAIALYFIVIDASPYAPECGA